MKRALLSAFAVFWFVAPAFAGSGFDVVALGARGGIQDGNLSAFLIMPAGDPRGVTCDAGSVVNGIRVAEEKGHLSDINVPADSDYTRVGHVLTDVIRGYLISNAHLDHIAGMIAASPDDSAKPIYALQSTLSDIESTYFNWDAWPNFGKTGKGPQLGKYDYVALDGGAGIAVANTAVTVTAFPLAHGPVESAAFLLESGGDAILCFGDTGPDRVQGTDKLAKVWKAVAPLAKSGALKAIVIESSYANARPDNLLFGHLTPKHIHAGLEEMAEQAGGTEVLNDLPVIISHIKYTLKTGPTPQETIAKELAEGNRHGVRFIIPEQGDRWTFGQ